MAPRKRQTASATKKAVVTPNQRNTKKCNPVKSNNDNDDDQNNKKDSKIDNNGRSIQDPTERFMSRAFNGTYYNDLVQRLFVDLMSNDRDLFINTLEQVREDLCNTKKDDNDKEANTESSEEKLESFLEFGGLSILLSTYKKWYTDADVVATWQRTVWCILYLSQKVKYTIQDHLVVIVLQLVVQSMKNFPNDALVHYDAIKTVVIGFKYVAAKMKFVAVVLANSICATPVNDEHITLNVKRGSVKHVLIAVGVPVTN